MKKKELSRLVEQEVKKVLNTAKPYYESIQNGSNVNSRAYMVADIIDSHDDFFIGWDLSTDKGTLLTHKNFELHNGDNLYKSTEDIVDEVFKQEKPKYLILDNMFKNSGMVVATVYNIIKKYADQYNYDINNMEIARGYAKPFIRFYIHIPFENLSNLENFVDALESELSYRNDIK